MSIDRSLRVKSALVRHRNVLSRAERVEQLKKDEKWAEDDSVFGLPKVAHRKSHAGKKEKVEGEAVAGAEVAGAAAAPAADAAKGGAKGGPKAAAPAAKATEKKAEQKKK
ncbi:MAG: small basic protein [Planctomycetota bacterium]|nr:small basic protein [Planctomycetota bacterium]